MKVARVRFLKKLKSISAISILNQGQVFQINSTNSSFQTQPFHKEQEEHKSITLSDLLAATNISPSEEVINVKDKEFDSGFHGDNKENLEPSSVRLKDTVPSSEIEEIASDGLLCTIPLIDQIQHLMESQNQQRAAESFFDSFKPNIEFPFEDKCPPGGRDSVIVYTTRLRGIRKTFEDCSTIKYLLESFRVLYSERDVSMHMEFRDELWKIMGDRVVPPRLFIRGRYIGGADEVVGLHEQGRLGKLLQGIPVINPASGPCHGCGGFHFVLCSNCNGSCKITNPESQANFPMIRCPNCNENGLVKCSICC